MKERIRTNWLEYLFPLFKQGYYIKASDNLIHKKIKGVAYDTPWIYHVREDSEINCIKRHTFTFNCYKRIALECFDCFKVVVRPATIIDLLKLRDYQKTLPKEIECKCGIEIRPRVPAAYGGYFYNKGLTAGLDMLDFVRQAMSQNKINIVGGIKKGIYLKRACTEFEEEFGRSDKWVHEPDEREISAFLDRKVHPSCWDHIEASLDEEQAVEVSWFNYAHDKGDLSYLLLTNGEPLYDHPVKYEREE